MAATPAQTGKLMVSFSFTDSSIGPILAWCVSLVKLKLPSESAAMPATISTMPTMRTAFMR